MMINQDGTIDNERNAVLLSNNDFIVLGENQFFQWTPTGKRLELWEGKKEYLSNDNSNCAMRKIVGWSRKTVICSYIYG